MDISSVGSVQNNTQNKPNYVKTGAKIGTAVGVGKFAINTINIIKNKQLIKDLYQPGINGIGKGASKGIINGGYAIALGLLMGVGAAIGAGIGAICQVVANKKNESVEKA